MPERPAPPRSTTAGPDPDVAEFEHRVAARRAALLALLARHRGRRAALVPGSTWLVVTFAPGATVADHAALDDAVADLLGVAGSVVAEGSSAAELLPTRRAVL